MGRHTYTDMCTMMKKRGIAIDSIENILPNRTSFVLSSNPNFKAQGATVVSSIRAAWQSLDEKDTRDIFILGGERVFIESLPFVTTIHLNIIKKSYDCDRFFPIAAINNNYTITQGEQTDILYQLKYQRIAPTKT